MANVAAGRLLLALAAVSAIPGSAAADRPPIAASSEGGPRTEVGGVSRAWLGRFGGAVAGALPVSGSAPAPTDGHREGEPLALWGRGTFSRFAGDEAVVALDGDVLTGTLGAEWQHGPWFAGLALSRSTAEGTWGRDGQGGRIESSVTGIYPFTGYRITDRVAVWCAGGYGIGNLERAGGSGVGLRTDVSMLMAAGGARGDLVHPGAATGPALSVEAAGLYATTTSAAARGMVAAEADMYRIRLALEGSWGIGLTGGTVFTPALEMGVRHDGGDAETGFGADLGGRLALGNAAGTLSVALSGQVSLRHETGRVRDGGVSASLLLATSW